MLCASLILGVHIATHHFDSAKYNDTNPGVYVQCNGVTVGTYKNSEYRQSSYAAFTTSLGPVDITAGAVTGYSRRGLSPLLTASVKLGPARVIIIPPYEKGPAAIHLAIEHQFR